MNISKVLFVSFSFIFFIVFPGFTIAQNENDSVDVSKGWLPGYIVLEEQKDTTFGFLKIDKEKIGYIKQVKFKKDNESEVLKFGGKCFNCKYKETLRFFGTKESRYRLVNWVDKHYKKDFFQGEMRVKDWVKLEEEGAINISLGFYMQVRHNTFNNTSTLEALPVYCLKKGTLPLAIIFSEGFPFKPNDIANYKINEKSKVYFMSFIEDDKVMAGEIGSKEEMPFIDVLD